MAKAGGSGPIGPYPPGTVTEDEHEEYDKLRRRVLWKIPSGLYVIGSTDGAERRNGMTLNWLTQVSFDPKWIAIGVEKAAFTHELIVATGVYTVNFVSKNDRAIVRKFTKPVDVDLEASTLNGFGFRDGAVTGAPILDISLAFIECETRQQIEIGDHALFLGEVVNCGFLADEDTPVLSMDDTRMNYGG